VSISTHVLDAASGRPAAAVPVRLERRAEDGWQQIASGRTDADGRLRNWLPDDLLPGVHRLVFDTASYHGARAFYPEVVVTFHLTDPAEHLHLPLLLSPFAYSTYRGS
jgi:5-hydroxyisourate hydrolase